MSSIPNNAMPHAQAEPETGTTGTTGQQGEGGTSGAFSQIADKAREYPKTAIAAGAAVAAGVAAAAVLTRGRSDKDSGSKKSKKD